MALSGAQITGTGVDGMPWRAYGSFTAKAAAAAVDTEGLEHVLPTNRMHYAVETARLHYALQSARLHYTISDNE
jgi:hypothetical protein